MYNINKSLNRLEYNFNRLITYNNTQLFTPIKTQLNKELTQRQETINQIDTIQDLCNYVEQSNL